MSVNGQDPRANVYLLDGTLLNDFTNGPAGSAAGTALGMETVREFRVETNSYSAEFGRNVGGQINAITKSGTNMFGGSAFEYHRNDALDARNYFDAGRNPTSRGISLAAPSAARFGATGCSSSSATRGCGRPRPDDRHDRARRQRAARYASDRTGDDRSGDPAVSRRVPARERRKSRRRTGQIHLPVRAGARSAFRSGARRRGARRTARNSSRATRSTTRISALPTDYPQFPRAFVRGISS